MKTRQKFPLLFILVAMVVASLCFGSVPSAKSQVETRPSLISFQLQEVTPLVGRDVELQMYVVITDGTADIKNNVNAAKWGWPAEGSVRLRPGEPALLPDKYFLSVDENKIGGQLYILVFAIDVMEQPLVERLTTDFAAGLLQGAFVEGVMQVAGLAGGGPPGWILGALSGMATGAFLEQSPQAKEIAKDVIILKRSEDWGVGGSSIRHKTSDGGMKIVYQIIQDTIPELPTQVPASSSSPSDLLVQATANNGVRFTAPVDGTYQFTVKDGIYCTMPGLCRSIVRGYVGRDIVWRDWYGNPHPMEQDYELGCWERDTAANPKCAIGLSVLVPMRAQQYIGWVIMEDRNSFADDTGGVQLVIDKLPLVMPPTPSTEGETLPNGEAVSPESLARVIGGNPTYWTRRGPVVWGYWDKGHNMTFRHPGADTILTYWAGFEEPRNADGCAIAFPESDANTRYVKCPSGTNTEFEADGVGFHLKDYTGFFP